MSTLRSAALAFLLLALAAPSALAENEIVRELTGKDGLGPDYLPKKQEYRLDPSSDFHYSSDPFLREKKGESEAAKKPSPLQFSIAPEDRTDPLTGERIEPGGNDADPLGRIGGKVQMDVNVLEF